MNVNMKSQDRVIDTVTTYGLDGPGFESSLSCTDQLCGPPSLRFNGYHGSFLVVIRLRRDGDHPLPSGTKVMNEWSYTFTPPYAFMA